MVGKRKMLCVKDLKLCGVGCVWAADFYLLQPVKAAGDCDKSGAVADNDVNASDFVCPGFHSCRHRLRLQRKQSLLDRSVC